jgi:hypothetical protein
MYEIGDKVRVKERRYEDRGTVFLAEPESGYEITSISSTGRLRISKYRGNVLIALNVPPHMVEKEGAKNES